MPNNGHNLIFLFWILSWNYYLIYLRSAGTKIFHFTVRCEWVQPLSGSNDFGTGTKNFVIDFPIRRYAVGSCSSLDPMKYCRYSVGDQQNVTTLTQCGEMWDKLDEKGA